MSRRRPRRRQQPTREQQTQNEMQDRILGVPHKWLEPATGEVTELGLAELALMVSQLNLNCLQWAASLDGVQEVLESSATEADDLTSAIAEIAEDLDAAHANLVLASAFLGRLQGGTDDA